MYRLALKFTMRNKKNTISIILGIALSVMLMFSLIQMGDSIAEKYKEFMVIGANQDFKVNKLNKEKAQLIVSSVKNKNLVNSIDVCSLSEYIGEVLFKEDGSLVGKLCAAEERNINTINNIKVVQGKFPEKPYEICIEKGIKNKLKTQLNIGDEIILELRDVKHKIFHQKFTICGFVNNTAIQSISSGQLSYVFTSYNTSSEITKRNDFELLDNPYSIDILVNKNKYDFDAITNSQQEILQVLNPNYNKLINKCKLKTNEKGEKALFKEIMSHISMNESKSKAYTEKGSYDAISRSTKLLALIIALGTILLVFNSINLMVIERIKQYGVLRCIGMSKKQLRKMIFCEIFIYSILGISLGIGLGLILNKAIGETLMSFIILEKVKLVQKCITYLSVIVLAFSTIIVACLKIFFHISKMTPMKALNHSETNNFKLKRVKQIKGTKNRNMVNLFSTRNILRNKTKSITIFISLSVCITLLMIISNSFLCIDFPKKNIKTDFSNYEIAQKIGDIGVDNIPEEKINEVAKLDKVKKVYAMNDGRRYYLEEKNTKKILSFNIYNDELFQKLIDYNKGLKGLEYKDEDVVILCNSNKDTNKTISSNKQEILNNYSEGNEIHGKLRVYYRKKETSNEGNNIEIERKSDEIIKIRINKIITENGFRQAGYYISKDSEEPYLIMNETKAKKIFGKLQYTDIMIDVNEKVTGEFEQKSLPIFHGIKDIVCTSYEAGLENNITQLIGMIVMAIYIIISTATVGFFNMSNTIKANIINRSKENGMLRAIGMSNKTLGKVMCLENVKLSFYASLISCVIALPVGAYISKMVSDKTKIHISVYIIISLLAIGASYLVSYFQVKKGFKKEIISLIKE